MFDGFFGLFDFNLLAQQSTNVHYAICHSNFNCVSLACCALFPFDVWDETRLGNE
jgi:hypothetical protein